VAAVVHAEPGAESLRRGRVECSVPNATQVPVHRRTSTGVGLSDDRATLTLAADDLRNRRTAERIGLGENSVR
jgi:hypothetical protein